MGGDRLTGQYFRDESISVVVDVHDFQWLSRAFVVNVEEVRCFQSQ